MRILLFIFPYAGLALSTISAIWGLTHELYTKDNNNRRHLTKEGKYSVAFTVLGLFVSLNTAVLKTITDNQDKATVRDEAARKDQQKTLSEIERSNRILFNIARGQYPLTRDFKVTPHVMISINHPLLANYSEKTTLKAREISLSANQGFRQGKGLSEGLSGKISNGNLIVNEIPLEKSSTLLPPQGTDGRLLLEHLQLSFAIYAKNRPVDGKPDLSFYYFLPDVFSRGPKDEYGLYYLLDKSSFMMGAELSPRDFLGDTGRIVSYLDLPGSTLIVFCSEQANHHVRSYCDNNVNLLRLKITPQSGPEIVIPGSLFEHEEILGTKCLVHRFNSDVDNFFEHYSESD